MTSVVPTPSSIQSLMQQAVSDRKISRWDYFQLTSLLLSDPGIDAAARSQVNQLLDEVRSGKIRLTD